MKDLRALADSARRKLLAAARPAPYAVHRPDLYTGWNAMAVTAYLETARVLRMDVGAGVCAADADRLLAEAWDGASARSM